MLARDGPRGRFLVKVQACQRCIYTHAEKLILVQEGLNASGVVGAHVQNARGASSARAWQPAQHPIVSLSYTTMQVRWRSLLNTGPGPVCFSCLFLCFCRKGVRAMYAPVVKFGSRCLKGNMSCWRDLML